MMWAVLAIAAALIWASVNVLDKFYMSKYVKNPMVPMFFLCAVGLVFGILVSFFRGLGALSGFNVFLALLAGAFYFFSVFLYFKAIKIEEVSVVAPLYYVSTIFTAFLAAIFLNEIFTMVKYLGVFFLMSGAILLSSRDLKFKMSRGFWFMILASLLMSVNTVLMKYLLGFADFWTVFSYVRFGMLFPLIPVLIYAFRDLKMIYKKYGVKVFSLITLGESMNMVAVLIFTLAISIGFVTLANALSAVQPFFVFLFALVLSVFFPKILKEEIGKKTLVIKFFSILMIFGGVVLIT